MRDTSSKKSKVEDGWDEIRQPLTFLMESHLRIRCIFRSMTFRTMESGGLKHQELPLARIKKIMKLDEDVKMISAEAPVLFAKAAEMFITELTMRAWIHTEDNKRRTLQRNDIAMAITK